MDLRRWLSSGVDAVRSWEETFAPFECDASLEVSDEQFAEAFGEFTSRLRDNYPFFHPSYAGQMLKPPHPAAVVGYLTAMLINPNNHALDGGPATAQMEKEVIAQLAGMFGLPEHLGHLSTSGTFSALLAGRDDRAGLDPAPWLAIAECDSVVVDPHKHGLQPYGCGAVLFADPDVGRFYLHDSPYTYFTSGDLHLGEISLECSRAGASAAAAWLTFRLLPLTADGLGRVLSAGRQAALTWAQLLADSLRLDLYQQPELDIVCYFPLTTGHRLSDIDEASARLLADGMAAPERPLFVSTLRVGADDFTRRHPAVKPDAGGARVVRSVLMKPESEEYVPELHSRAEELARQLENQ